MLARHEEDPVRPGSRERGQGFHRVRVRRQHALQTSQRFRLRAAERRVVSRAALPREPVELEGVAVQDEVCRAAALRVQRLQKERELLAPAKVFLDTPRPRYVPAEAHVQVRDDGDQPRRVVSAVPPAGSPRRAQPATTAAPLRLRRPPPPPYRPPAPSPPATGLDAPAPRRRRPSDAAHRAARASRPRRYGVAASEKRAISSSLRAMTCRLA